MESSETRQPPPPTTLSPRSLETQDPEPQRVTERESGRDGRRQPWWLGLALAAASGVLLGLAYPPAGAWWLAWVALAPLLVAASRSSVRGAFGCGWVAGLVWFGMILDWLRLFGEPPFNTIMWLLAVGIEAAFVGLFAMLARGLLVGRVDGLFLVGVPALWTVCEWLRCTGPWGFPWGVLGETQSQRTTLIQFAAVTGGWGVTFLVALVNGYVAGVVLSRWRINLSPSPSPKRGGVTVSGRGSDVPVVPCDNSKATPEGGSPSPLRGGGQGERFPNHRRSGALVGAALGAALVYGIVVTREAEPRGRSLRVAVVQGNVEQEDGWRENRREPLGKYGELTRQALARQPELVVWPETVVSGDLRRDFGLLTAVGTLAREGRCYLLVGTPHVDDQSHVKNAAALVGPNGELAGWYEKVHLVPFGEYIPFRQWLPFLDRFPSVTDQSPGDGYRPLAAGETRVGTMICFESAFPGISRELVRRGAGLLAVLTSDASFGRTAAAEHHAAKAIFRAIETRRWVVQAATTGVSLAVDPRGQVRARLDLFRAGILTADAVVGGPTTAYVRFGDWLVALCGLVVLGLVVKKRKDSLGQD